MKVWGIFKKYLKYLIRSPYIFCGNNRRKGELMVAGHFLDINLFWINLLSITHWLLLILSYWKKLCKAVASNLWKWKLIKFKSFPRHQIQVFFLMLCIFFNALLMGQNCKLKQILLNFINKLQNILTSVKFCLLAWEISHYDK
jgi:hypothetical protein